MSETYRQQAFGRPTFIDASASGSSSGRDHFDILDAANLYHDQHDYPGHRVQPLHIAVQDGYPPGHQFAYPSHSSGVSLPGLQYTSPTMAGHIPQPYEHESAIQVLEELQGFSPITPNPYGISAYRTPYADSNATSTSSATSPDPANAGVITDAVIVEADEDKRKRNQAASARFRQKKKQREQQLMESSRDMQERTRKLEAENEGLKKENLFLKKLLVEKVDHMSDEDREMLKKATEGTLNGKRK
ncbi:uncharacterized protein K460DRAFT_26457 [Cucurbitaria berberidis CBS 394.84]|uniref:BZIP domain-containing protein n=1 Tax=Cucurbitaria berberidis CBS 394.84 TaxID=1168544 RepID=A0A9P4GT36_9PLEO|nr:uncharacterized protein K460DRAFT_26457 [Cucurbitaria berberidis CBS 394.84]KAF1851024.1 hypothetical protein K460DRAFT_26457 [Cucurbitaria berberidis CBS 394.84]